MSSFKTQWTKKCKNSQKQLVEIAVKAREQHMSYGEYQSQLYMAAEAEKRRKKMQYCTKEISY